MIHLDRNHRCYQMNLMPMLMLKIAANQEYVYHKVEKGDTLWNIAKRYEGVTVKQIMEFNRITDITNLKPGTKLKVKVNG
ncbi:MAG: LysM peptidoglycan-binding domain-containing protein [Bacteroidetes bacterium]|nr:LysM peptidoglycan-binding domain-containing protein [Bacteroidota bacterium]